jgi:site-specific recombinase XerD
MAETAAMERARELAADWLSGHHNENTRRSYEGDIERFFAWCEEEGLAPLELRRAEGNRYLSHLIEQGLSSRTIHRRLASTRMFYEYPLSEEVIERNPLQFVKFRWQRGDSETPWLDLSEMRQLLEATLTESTSPLRDFVLVFLLLMNGMRATETCMVRIEDLGQTGGVPVLWVKGKGRKRQRKLLDPAFTHVLEQYLNWLGNPPEGPLLVSVDRHGNPRRPLRALERVAVSKRVKKLAAAAGVNPDIGPHSLRHSHITNALALGIPLARVQIAVGHANPATTMGYNRDAENIAVADHPTTILANKLFDRDPEPQEGAAPMSPAPVELDRPEGNGQPPPSLIPPALLLEVPTVKRRELERPRQWSKSRVEDAFRRFYAEHKRTPSPHRDTLGNPDMPSTPTVQKLYGSWSHALQAAGLPARAWRIGKESIAESLADWRERNGRWPTAADIERDSSLPGKSTMQKYLGTVSAARFAEMVPEILRGGES